MRSENSFIKKPDSQVEQNLTVKKENTPAPVPVSEKELAADEARTKIRDFLHDPNLKFHFASLDRLKSEIERGIFSESFARKIGENLKKGLHLIERDPKYLSVSDRNKDSDIPEKKDWWLKVMTQEWEASNDFGIVLPSDLRVSDETPHISESYTTIRISPKKFDGLFVINHEYLDKTIPYETLPKQYWFREPRPIPSSEEFLKKYFGEFLDLSDDMFEKEEKLEELIVQNEEGAPKRVLSGHATELDEEIIMSSEIQYLKKRELADRRLSEIMGIGPKEITLIDILKYFAQQAKIPLYVVEKDLETSRVVWPEVAGKK